MPRGPVHPVARDRLALMPLGEGERDEVRIAGGLLGRRQERNQATTIPYGLEVLEESGTLENFRIAAGRSSAPYSEPLFRDSDLYKVLEAVAWARQGAPVPEQEAFFVRAVELVSAAQREDGYLDTYVQVVDPGGAFSDPAMGHELYCAGHLLQATVAAVRSGAASSGIGEVARRLTDFFLAELRSARRDFVPGHPEIEAALVELWRQGGRSELLELAGELVARRGARRLSWRGFGPEYFQDDLPVEEASTVRGHAVRALYLLSGVVDLGVETGRQALLDAAVAQWEDMASTKTYLTGGVGSRHRDEAFGDPFELPPDRAYCETCAAIASVMLSWRLLLCTGEGRFADLVERTLYNGVLAGYGLDGRSFFYVNPLQTRLPEERRPWYHVACCPPNLMRMFASLQHYLATISPAGVQLHLYAAGRFRVERPGGLLELEVETDYPNDGAVRVRVAQAPGEPLELAFRVPRWASSCRCSLNDRLQPGEPGPDGYLRVRRAWSPGDEVMLELPLEVRTVLADHRVDAVRGCVALERGPLVYCLEGVDLPSGASLEGLSLAPGTSPRADLPLEVAGEEVVPLRLEALVREPEGAGAAGAHGGVPSTGAVGYGGWPYRAVGEVASPALRPLVVRAVPYHAWANRGPSTMRVWLPATP